MKNFLKDFWSTRTSAAYYFYSDRRYGNFDLKKAKRAWRWNRMTVFFYHLRRGTLKFWWNNVAHDRPLYVKIPE